MRDIAERVTQALRHLATDLPDPRLAALVDQGAEVRLPPPIGGDWIGIDLAVCIAVLVHAGVVPPDPAAGLGYVGALGPFGNIHVTPGIPDAVCAAYRRGLAGVVVPQGRQAIVATVLETFPVPTYAADSLDSLVDSLRGHRLPSAVVPWISHGASMTEEDRWNDWASLADVAAGHPVRPAVELAAAGRLGLVVHGIGDGAALSHATDARIATLVAAAMPALTAAERADLACVRTRENPHTSGQSLWRRPVERVALGHAAERWWSSTAALAGHGVLLMAHLGVWQIHRVNDLIRCLRDLREAGEPEPLVVATVAACACGRHAWQLCGCPVSLRDRYLAAARRVADRLQRAGICDLEVRVAMPLIGEDRRDGGSTAQVRARVIRADQARRARVEPRDLRNLASQSDPVTRVARTIADLRGLTEVDDACRAEAQQWRGPL